MTTKQKNKKIQLDKMKKALPFYADFIHHKLINDFVDSLIKDKIMLAIHYPDLRNGQRGD